MPLDAICLAAVAEELSPILTDARVDKLQQPEKDVIILSARGKSGNFRLLISAGKGSARVHITDYSRENPDAPPMFCMLLRKHLTGARITALEQPHNERMYILRFACFDEMGQACEKTMAVEMMGRSTNIVLIDEEGRIIDCLYRIDAQQSQKRQLLPGMFYRMPPDSGKNDPFELSAEDFTRLYDEAGKNEQADAWLVNTLMGISPLFARELLFRACGSSELTLGQTRPEELLAAFVLLSGAEREPVMLMRGDRPFELYCMRLRQYEGAAENVRYDSFSQLLDAFFTRREHLERLAQRCQNVVKTVKNRRDRAAKKLALRTAELQNAENRELLRQRGDIIKANIYRMSRGMSVLKAENFYSESGEETQIPLDVRLSPQQNAEVYYKAYNKAKNAARMLGEQIEQARTETEYLESVLEELTRVDSEKDIDEICAELRAEGYLRDEKKTARRKPAQPRPMVFTAPGGNNIYVGRSNTQNDWLTLKFAGKSWLWFHVQKAHGAHVVVQCAEDDTDTIEAAAMLAAYYSKGRESSNVPVDYTRVKNVKKSPGARPGMVIYTDFKTLFITPDKKAVEALSE